MNNDIVDKIEVARRQTKEAIFLFFEEREDIAIYTIIAAAHQVLFDLGKRQDVISAIKNHQSLPKNINSVFNFLKHADKDPDKKINAALLKEIVADYIMDSIQMLQALSNNLPIEAKIFWYWFVSKHPEGFNNLPEDGEIRKMQQENIGEWDFATIRQFLLFYETMDGQPL